MNSIEQYIIEEQVMSKSLNERWKMLSERQLQIQQCKVQEVQSSVTSSGDETSSRIVSDEEIEKKNWKHITKDDSDVIPDSSNICTNDNHVDQNAAECVDERVALANLIANLTLDTEENKTF
ncbi:hypothetical protein Tco_1065555 [Tanacetum coccineum]